MIFQLLVILLIFVLALVYYYATIPSNIPKGPLNLPLIGHPVMIYGGDVYLQFEKWYKKYGDLFSFYMGNQLVIVISSYELSKEAFLKQADLFVGKRPPSIAYKMNFDQGLILNDGSLWKEHRRFSLSTLRDFGLGKPILENGIVEECQHVCAELTKVKGQPADVQHLLTNAVSNVICQLVFGKRFSYDDQQFKDVLRSLNDQTANQLSLGGFLLPFAYYLPSVRRKLKNFTMDIENIKSFIQKFVKLERTTFDVTTHDEPVNYIQAFLKAQQTRHDPCHFTDLQLTMAVYSLFAAGTETTANTIRWGILLCATYPKIQQKLREELDSVIGKSSLSIFNVPKLEHRKHLPYTEAVLLEIQRYATLVPFTGRFMHEATMLGNYSIPKGSIVIRNQWSIHHDQKYYTDPFTFNPDRFLDSNGKTLKPEAFVPFGMGKRSCLGESLAKMELFLFFTYIMHKFEFTFPPDQPNPSLKHCQGMTLKPAPFSVIANIRQ